MWSKIVTDHSIGMHWWYTLADLAKVSFSFSYQGTEVTR